MSRNRISVGGLFSPVRDNQSLDKGLLDDDIPTISNIADEYIKEKQSRSQSSEKNLSANSSSHKLDKINQYLQCKQSSTVCITPESIENFSDDSLASSSSERVVKEKYLHYETEKKSSSNYKSKSYNKNIEKLSGIHTAPSNTQTVQLEQIANAKATNNQRKEKMLEKLQHVKNRCVSDYSGNLQNTKHKKVHHRSDNALREQNITMRATAQKTEVKAQKTIPDIRIENHLGETTEEITNLNAAEPTKVSSNIIEKLISDAVSFEFDAVRQQLYHQQFSQSMLINNRFNEMEEKNNEIYGKLFEITQELMEENRILRNMLARYIS